MHCPSTCLLFSCAVLPFVVLHCTQVAASVEDQLVAARTSIEALHVEREQRERDVDKLQDAFRQMLTIRCAETGATQL